MKKTEKLYNIIFPLWLLIWVPLLWFALVPINYFIDRTVLYFSLNGGIDKNAICRKYGWKICIAGFAADLAGSAALFSAVLLCDDNYRLANAISYDPFSSLIAFMIIVTVIAVCAFIIYFLDLKILRKSDLDEVQIRRSALYLALFTAPYLFLLPMKWFW